MSLKETLDQFYAEVKAKMPAERIAMMQESIDKQRQQHLAQNAKSKGDKVESFSLPNAKGEMVSLDGLLKDGPVVLTFYRGSWCPFCNFELKALQERLTDFKALNTNLVAVSPQKPDQSLSMVEKNALEFEVLSDLQNKVARNFGLVFKIDEALQPFYDEVVGLSDYNGDDSYELPMASTFIIDTDGTVMAAYNDEDYKTRMEPEEIVAILKDKQAG